MCIISFMKYHVIVFGCQMNTSDAERLAAVFENLKFKKTKDINKADIIAVVMCSVRQSAVDRVHWLAHSFAKQKKANPELMTILTGCVLKKDKNKFAISFDYILDIKDIKQIKKIARECDLERTSQAPPAWSRVARGGARIERAAAGPRALAEDHFPSGYVPIMNGCNNFCAYCVVPYTRGREISRPVKEILREIKNLVKNKHKEIWLLGQNVNSYKDKKTNFPKLLKMADNIPGNFELNFTSSHPKDFSDELIKTMAKCKKLSKRLNLPIQSGDDKILRKMNRPYTVEKYKNLIKKIRKIIPDISLSTDVIVGFPGETKKQFNNTVKAFKEIGFDMAFINKYSPREGTAAAKLKDNVSWQEKKRREKILIKLANE